MYENDIEWSPRTIKPYELIPLFLGTSYINGESRIYSIAYIYHKCNIDAFKDIDDWAVNISGIGSTTMSKSIKRCIEDGWIIKEYDTSPEGKKINGRYVLTDSGIDLLYKKANENDALLSKDFIKICYIKYLINFLNWRIITHIAVMLFHYKNQEDLFDVGKKAKEILNTKYETINDENIDVSVGIIKNLFHTNTIRR